MRGAPTAERCVLPLRLEQFFFKGGCLPPPSGPGRARVHVTNECESPEYVLGAVVAALLFFASPRDRRAGEAEAVEMPALAAVGRAGAKAGRGGGRRGTGVPGGHDTHRPFTNRKAAPGEGTVIRARVGRPIPFRARSAQGPVHFPPTWRVMMRRCHQASQDRGGGRGRRAEGWAEARAGGGRGGFFFSLAEASLAEASVAEASCV